MAKLSATKQPVIAIDLSSLPPSLQDAVGDDVAKSVLSRSGSLRGPVVIGKLGPGVWGMINPELLGKLGKDQIGSLLKGAGIRK